MRTKDENKTKNIFRATLDLVQEIGIAGLTMADIAREANIATGTIYIYFKNKEVLLNELYCHLAKLPEDRILKNIDEKDPVKTNLEKIWRNYLSHRVNYFDESLFIEQYYYSPYITKEQKESVDKIKTFSINIMKRGQEEKIIDSSIDLEMIFWAITGFIRTLAYEQKESSYTLSEEKIDQAFKLNWKMIV